MVFLFLFAQRIHPSSRWMFWRSDYAFVTAWIDAPNAASAKLVAEESMAARGWRIIRYERATAVRDERLPDDLYSRIQIRKAKTSKGSFGFWRASAEGGSGLMYMPKIVGDESGSAPDAVAYDIDEQTVPPRLRPALRLGEKWAISDDARRTSAIGGAPADELRSVVEAVMPLQAEIEAWSDARRGQSPVPDEVTLFDRLLEAVTEMEAELSRAARTDPSRIG